MANEYELLNQINQVPDEKRKLDLFRKLSAELKYNKLAFYKPLGHPETLCYGGPIWKEKFKAGVWAEWSNKPWQLNFHNAGKDHQERMIMAANRVGKTHLGAYEVAYHMTGKYPDWWEGVRFKHPVLVWTGSPTNETSRDIVQAGLLGGLSKEELGSGSIPRTSLIGKPKSRQAGVSDVVDTFKVRHEPTGGVSTCILKTYEQGWRKWQGTEPHVVWMDEEPEPNEAQGKIRTEATTRLLTSHGVLLVTFTPLLGQTDIVVHFQGGGEGIYLDGATWEDAPHLNRKERDRLAASYPDNEVQARTQGVPMMGEGKIFQTPEDEVICAPFVIPAHFTRLKGIDFGLLHKAAVADIAWDRDNDIIYLTRIWREKCDVAAHCQAITAKDPWVPVAWPHDGLKSERGRNGAEQIKTLYVAKGMRFLARSARYKNDIGGGQPQWPIIEEIKDREETGGFKIFSTCREYIEERRNYHTKNGQIVSRNDDALKAAFYAVMMKRYSITMNRAMRTSDTSRMPTAVTM